MPCRVTRKLFKIKRGAELRDTHRPTNRRIRAQVVLELSCQCKAPLGAFLLLITLPNDTHVNVKRVRFFFR